VRELVERELHDGRPVRVGVGEAFELGASPPRTIAVLVSRGDLYLDQSGQSRGVVLRWRDLVVDGESKVTTTFRKAEWESELGALAAQVGVEGHGLAQAIVDEEYQLHLLEINARLGGATPLALACGLNSIEWFLMESSGESLGELSPFDYPAGKRLSRDDAGRDAFSEI